MNPILAPALATFGLLIFSTGTSADMQSAPTYGYTVAADGTVYAPAYPFTMSIQPGPSFAIAVVPVAPIVPAVPTVGVSPAHPPTVSVAPSPPPTAVITVPPAPTGSIVESRIDGEFIGWSGDTIFKLQNGQIWQQSTYAYIYYYAYSPSMTIYQSGGAWRLKVDGLDQTVLVVRLN